LDGAYGQSDGGLGGVYDRKAGGGLQAAAVSGHSGAAHDEHVCAVFLCQLLSYRNHSLEDTGFVRELSDSDSDGAVAGTTGFQTQGTNIAGVAGEGLFDNRDDAETASSGHRD
jgi:hypothetical protein